MRRSIDIKVWMLRNGYSVESIRKALGYAKHTQVSLTVSGKGNNRRVLRYLQEKGCPERFLNLPKDMEKAA